MDKSVLHRRVNWITALVVVVLLAVIAVGLLTNKPHSSAGGCDPSLGRYIYNPSRLETLRDCLKVTGVIEHQIVEPDGDIHIRLRLDQPYAGLINDHNRLYQHGDLVVEPVCERRITQLDAAGICGSYRSPIVVPPDGTHVTVVGRYVLDHDHGWLEIHPPTSITPS